MKKQRLSTSILVFLFFSSFSFAQPLSLDTLFIMNSYPLNISNEKLSGKGLDFILSSTKNAQFVAIAEEHNIQDIPEFTSAIFKVLHDNYNFNYLALEQATVTSRMLLDKPLRGNLDAITKFVREYPNSPTFATDQELKMLADVVNYSTGNGEIIWGLDPEFGVSHILNKLLNYSSSEEIINLVNDLKNEAEKVEKRRFTTDTLFIWQGVNPEDYKKLLGMYIEENNAEAVYLVEDILTSNEIFRKHAAGGLQLYSSVRQREDYMKSRFATEYKMAEKKDNQLPKVLLKLGHFHISRGIHSRNLVPTLGNFASEFSKSNEMDTYIISTYVTSGDEKWRITGGLEKFENPNGLMLVDLKALRPYAMAKKIKDLSEGWKRLIFAADAMLLISNSKAGTYNYTRDYKE